MRPYLDIALWWFDAGEIVFIKHCSCFRYYNNPHWWLDAHGRWGLFLKHGAILRQNMDHRWEENVKIKTVKKSLHRENQFTKPTTELNLIQNNVSRWFENSIGCQVEFFEFMSLNNRTKRLAWCSAEPLGHFYKHPISYCRVFNISAKLE